ncbi:MAG: D-alanine--D-alanine ligase [Clostridia bacterium]|nr:D-alanine--D-alanine ligase [Clostridia bacterium]
MIKLLVIFGGMSSEHEISCISAGNVLENINKTKYIITKAGVDKFGNWYIYNGDNKNIKANIWLEDKDRLKTVDNIIEVIKACDVAYPILHGKYGEDGTIQGLFELLNTKYVGCNYTTSAIGMDKEYSKILAKSVDIPIVEYQVLKKHEKLDLKLSYPLIVKPNGAGSSYGVTKVNNSYELDKAIKLAFEFDEKILIERFIPAREIECAVLGNNNYIISDLGEIVPANEFYDFEAKYESNASICKIPAQIDQKEEIREYVKRFSNVIGIKGLSRIDFFVAKDTNNVYFNEINTMPGFTDISMYPKLIENYGISYSDLIDKLIELAI